ncbi:flagellar basal body L-ring protein FlgH [Paraburkholderia caballeronis]|uniref:Flagellar L-ring protein n=1 Tax=Paraburkholderia caballeronis TaxID=416943 RepID=A0A1H7SNP7_9BURK|nr:flagellar basal body L-ring protein FlgH [Paraburkholderia caballeronis]PXW22371.1 flagellar L-ring protein precursor FlgH [Paraburkholderia caballeronis]PXW96029.1 flagellar L-ring protein precursor FlgH [Paraburkholderia caballeronis]RAJ92395.1 flagellar L-ring protein precursor FlgH [Paraburkholderia caballeronis]TDV08060.1 flagellar L-ring protein precursor FlgH [Paraburkholderia caballeronis]TDV11876.1 flagellar L-ring protein precursor FlgH [Paraburkholderia caballeronis]
MAHSVRIHSRKRVPSLAAVAAGAALAVLAGCAMVPKQPITQQPMTAAPPMPPVNSSPGAIFNPGYAGRPLFEDQRPRNIGDILTIVIAENINATKSSGANTKRAGSSSFSVPTAGFLSGLFSRTNLNAQGANQFDATGGANASNTFNGVLTVTVTNVLPNGNLVVSGEKQMLINQGNEFVRFSGVVNPNTVAGDNSVASTEVADAKIEYSAKGYIDEAETMGWLQRFFLNVAPW